MAEMSKYMQARQSFPCSHIQIMKSYEDSDQKFVLH